MLLLRRGMSSMPEGVYHAAADRLLGIVERRLEILEETMDDVDVEYSQGVLNINLGTKGIWVLNKQGPNQQIWWSSPLSGPRRYEYVQGDRWVNTRDDNQDILGSLAKEIEEVCGVRI